MKQYIDTAQDISGNALPFATCKVLTYPGGANAAIFSDNGLTPIGTSIVSADVTGQFSFFVADGDYQLQLSNNGAVYKTQTPVSIFDGAAQLTFPDTGTANNYAIASSNLEKALRAGLRCSVQITNSSTGASTLAYNGLAAKPIVLPGGAAISAGGILIATGIYGFEYDGTSWQLRNESAAVPIFVVIPGETAAGVVPSNLNYPPGHPFRYGAVDDAATNCNTALQKWINVGQKGVPLQFPAVNCAGGYLITAALSITGPLSIYGGGLPECALLCSGCDGFQIAAGVAQVQMENFRINQLVRYQAPNGTVTVNAFAAIRIQGSSGNQNDTHLYRNIFMDGFQTALVGGGLQFSLIDYCQAVFGLNGIICTGLAANVTVRGGQYQCGNLSNAGTLTTSIGVQFGDGSSATQGCNITDGCIITGFATNVWLLGANFCKVFDSFLDFTNGVALLAQSVSNASTSHDIRNNYIAMTALGTTAIRLLSNTASSNVPGLGTRVHNNTIITYANGTNVGIRVDGTSEQSDLITDNTISILGAAAVADLLINADASSSGASHMVIGNNFLGLGSSITVPCTYVGNRGACITNPNTFVLQPLFAILQAALAYSASMTPNLLTTNSFLITATTGVAFTINNPTNPPAQGGNRVHVWIINASGGALGAVTWGASYKTPAGITYPANGFRRCYTFEQGTAGGLYYLVVSPTVDIPN